MSQAKQQDGSTDRPLIEWIAGGVGLVLTLLLLGFVGWQAVHEPEQRAPIIEVEVTAITRAGEGYLVEIAASNLTTQTASGVQVKGVISGAGGRIERSSTTFDYVPGHSEVRGGLFFNSDPAEGGISVRALGYRLP